MTVAVVARAEKQGPLVKCADRWPMVTCPSTNWQNWRLVRETEVDSDMRLAHIAGRPPH